MEDTDLSPMVINAQYCVAGGSPAGLMSGMLLARAGVETIVLEKHVDFLQNQMAKSVLQGTNSTMPPHPPRLVNRSALLKRITGRVLGLGIRTEQLKT